MNISTALKDNTSRGGHKGFRDSEIQPFLLPRLRDFLIFILRFRDILSSRERDFIFLTIEMPRFYVFFVQD